MRGLLSKFLALVGTLAATALLAGYLGPYHWVLDLASHFTPHYGMVLAVVAALLGLAKRRAALAFAPFALLATISVFPLYFGGSQRGQVAKPLKILCANLLSSNRQYERALAYIEEKSPDILILQEFNQRWKSRVTPRLTAYPYRLVPPREGNFGMALYSKIPFERLVQADIGQSGVPSIIGELAIYGRRMTLVATHPVPPTDQAYTHRRNAQLRALGQRLADTSHARMVIGDLNTTAFSWQFKAMARQAGLLDSRRGFGRQPSWPARLGWAGITLDHCLVSEGIRVQARETGPNIGSDHRPIYLEIGFE